MTEQQLQNSIIEYFKFNKLYVLRVNSGLATNYYTGNFMALAEKGHSDLICEDRTHRIGFIEVKTSTGRLNDHQISFLRECHKRGNRWAVIDSLADVTRWLDDGDYHGAEKFTKHILDDSKKFIPSNVRNRKKTDGVDFMEYEMFCRSKESTEGKS